MRFRPVKQWRSHVQIPARAVIKQGIEKISIFQMNLLWFRVQMSARIVYIVTQLIEKSSIFQMTVFVVDVVFVFVVFQSSARAVYNHTKDLEDFHLSDDFTGVSGSNLCTGIV